MTGTGDTWYRRAACRGADPELFFPDRGGNGTGAAVAKAYCRACLVREACLAAALAEERAADRKVVHGVRGGLTAAERLRVHESGQAVA